MRNEEFEVLLTDVIREYGAGYIELPAGKYDKPHEFSAGFERKMQKLIKRQRHFYFPLVRTPVRRAAVIFVTAVVSLSVMVMSVGAFREAFVHFITEIFDTHTQVRSPDSDEAPKDFRDIYEITALPDGMRLTKKSEAGRSPVCLSREYKNGDLFLYFRQYIKSAYNQNINTEGYEMQPVSVNGCEGFLVDFGEDAILIWDNGDYIFYMHGNIDNNSIISAAKSVQKVE